MPSPRPSPTGEGANIKTATSGCRFAFTLRHPTFLFVVVINPAAITSDEATSYAFRAQPAGQ